MPKIPNKETVVDLLLKFNVNSASTMTSDELTINLQLFQHYDEKGVLDIGNDQTIDLCYIQEGSMNHTTYKSKVPSIYSTIRVFTIVEANGNMFTDAWIYIRSTSILGHHHKLGCRT